MPFLPPNQQRQSPEGNLVLLTYLLDSVCVVAVWNIMHVTKNSSALTRNLKSVRAEQRDVSITYTYSITFVVSLLCWWLVAFSAIFQAFSALTLLAQHRVEHLACKNWLTRCRCGYLSEVQMVCIWSGQYHCRLKILSSLVEFYVTRLDCRY